MKLSRSLLFALAFAPAFLGATTYRAISSHQFGEAIETNDDSRFWRNILPTQPLSGEDRLDAVLISQSTGEYDASNTLIFKTDGDGDITGNIMVGWRDDTSWKKLRRTTFRIKASALRPATEKEFNAARRAYYSALIRSGAPGESWFRAQRDRHAPETPKSDQNSDDFFGPSRRDPNDLIALFSGADAIRDNLQLDRPLRPLRGANNECTVPLSAIPGITVKEFDWRRLIAPGEVALDPLAGVIPHDQHVVFFPDFAAMTRLLDEADARGTPLMTAALPRSEDARTMARYARQLCLGTTEFARLAGPHLVRSVAFTGSDLYLPSGSDVGLVLKAASSELLLSYLRTKHDLAIKSDSTCAKRSGEISGTRWEGVENAARTVRSFVAVRGDTVFLTNSPAQLARLLKTASGETPSLSSLPEYKFFRQRHPLGAPGESAFIYLSDATIRRWCGPRWRILAARRAVAAAALGVRAAAGVSDPKAAQPSDPEYGSLAFLTPISELSADKVLPQEAQSYVNWSDNYQNNWKEYFDPIAVSLRNVDGQLAADITVTPLILNGDTNRMLEWVRGGDIGSGPGDTRPGVCIRHTMAINPKSRSVRELENLFDSPHGDEDPGENPAERLASAIRPRPFAWLGSAMSLRLDESPFMGEVATTIARYGEDSPEVKNLLLSGISRLPLSLWVENRDSASLAVFLTALRGKSDTSAPGLLVWKVSQYAKNNYVTVAPSDSERGFFRNIRLHYHAGPKALFLTLSEEVMKSYLDSLTAPGKAPAPLGKHAELNVAPTGLELAELAMRRNRADRLRESSWAALPVLNELHRAAPDQNPVALYEKLWGVSLVCPLGGRYVWDESRNTMRSSATGCPEDPVDFAVPPILPGFSGGDFGMSFENEGVRVRLTLKRTSVK